MLGNPPLESGVDLPSKAESRREGDQGAAGASPVPDVVTTPQVEISSAPARATARGWPFAVTALVLALAWICGWYWDTGKGIVDIWIRSATFAHGFIVVPIAAWLVWRRRDILARLEPVPSALPLAGLGVAAVAWLIGESASVDALAQFAFVSMLVLSVAAVLGLRVSRVMLFPLLYVFFAVPFGEFCIPQLMLWTADFTVAALRVTGVPVYREGTYLIIPSGTWSVIEACSGARYLIASLVVGTLYAYLSYRSLKRRLLFVGCAIVVPIVANWMRAYMIVMLGHLSNNRLAAGVDHLIYGWVFFGLVIMLMFWIGGTWREDGPVAVGAAPVRLPPQTPARTAAFPLILGAIALTTVIAPLIERRLDSAAEHGMLAELGPVTPAAGWNVDTLGAPAWRPVFETPVREQHFTATGAAGRVDGHVFYYQDQTRGHKLVSSMNQLVRSTNQSWAPLDRGVKTVRVAGQALNVQVTELVARGDGKHRLVWKWYWVDGHLTASDQMAKLWTAWARLQGHGDDSAAIVVSAEYDTEKVTGAEALLQSFVDAHLPALLSSLEGPRRTQ